MKLQQVAVLGVAALTLVPAAAGAVSMAPRLAAGLVQPIAYGDMPTSNARHRGGRKRGPIAHDPSPTVPDMHGATREGADKQYRSKYGF